jgi:hypothetical protein
MFLFRDKKPVPMIGSVDNHNTTLITMLIAGQIASVDPHQRRGFVTY